MVKRYQCILVAVDFSPYSQRALARGAMMAAHCDAQLHLLHVVEAPTYPVLEDVAVMGLPGMWDAEVTQALMAAAKKRLQQMAAQLSLENVEIDVLVGTAKVDIVEHAQQIGAELIVLGRHGEGFLQSLIGSVTDSVMHHAHCDVLAVNLESDEEGLKNGS
ncbi:MAG TPA: universal stress protein [Piscirickettsiaceae bacterium]|nr:universal stress protein [Piscirickettsiaceae bacterium]HIQ40473.1 universal stress protein [Sulfurivirga caldicuralii]